MIRRAVRIQLIAFVVITVLGFLYLGFELIGVDALRPPFTVRAQLASSGGIFTNAEVTYRGVRIGRVGDLRLIEDGVEVDLVLERGKRVPRDTLAVVTNKSAVGEQFVDLQPRVSGGPYLRGGDTIPLADTRVPIDIQTVAVDLHRLIRDIDREALTTLVSELGDAFDDTGSALQRLIDEGGRLTATLQAALPETRQLIRDGEVVLAAARDTSGDFREFAQGMALLAETLRVADPSVRQLLDNGVVAARELDALIRPHQQAIAVLLGDLVTVNELQVARIGGLRETLTQLPELVAVAPKALVDGCVPACGSFWQLHNGLVTDEVAPACTYPQTQRRLPTDKRPRDPELAAHCPPGTSGQRGAEYAPRPAEGSAAAPGPGPSGVVSPPPGQAESPALGWTGGQSDVLGDRSWLALLLALFQR